MKVLISLLSFAMMLGLTSATALAASAPAFTSATYDVSSGKLVITGTDLVGKTGDKNDIDLSKVTITNGLDQSYTLKSKGEINASSTTKADIVLSDAEQVALVKFLDCDGTEALNGGVYQINVSSGWDGTTSTTDVSKHALTVSKVVLLDEATYDYSKGELTIKGENLLATTGDSNDITPKYFTISDGKTYSYTLTTKGGVELKDSSSAVITLTPADKLALESVFDQDGKKSLSGNTYCITAAYGWDGTKARAALGDHAVTVSKYAKPVITLAADITVTYGGTFTIPANTFSKVGTVYVVPSSTDLKNATVTSLDALVTGKTALKATIADITKIVSISTKTSTTVPFTFTADTANYKLVEVDKVGSLSDLSTKGVTINNVPAPVLSAAAAKGTTNGTKVTATVTADSSDTLAYKVSSASIDTPKVGADVSSSTTAFTSGSDITGVDATTNKYLGVYEVKAGKVVKFKLIVLSASTIKADANQSQSAPTGLAGVAPTTVSNNNGQITGVATTMEYKLHSASTWTTVTGTTINGLAAGNYDVRYAAKTGYNAGTTASVTVPAYVALDTSAIDTAIAAANAAKVGVSISTDGSDVAIGTMWVTQADSDALDDAIATATSAKASAVTTQDVTNAAAALDDAVDTYTAAETDGTM